MKRLLPLILIVLMSSSVMADPLDDFLDSLNRIQEALRADPSTPSETGGTSSSSSSSSPPGQPSSRESSDDGIDLEFFPDEDRIRRDQGYVSSIHDIDSANLALSRYNKLFEGGIALQSAIDGFEERLEDTSLSEQERERLQNALDAAEQAQNGIPAVEAFLKNQLSEKYKTITGDEPPEDWDLAQIRFELKKNLRVNAANLWQQLTGRSVAEATGKSEAEALAYIEGLNDEQYQNLIDNIKFQQEFPNPTQAGIGGGKALSSLISAIFPSSGWNNFWTDWMDDLASTPGGAFLFGNWEHSICSLAQQEGGLSATHIPAGAVAAESGGFLQTGAYVGGERLSVFEVTEDNEINESYIYMITYKVANPSNPDAPIGENFRYQFDVVLNPGNVVLLDDVTAEPGETQAKLKSDALVSPTIAQQYNEVCLRFNQHTQTEVPIVHFKSSQGAIREHCTPIVISEDQAPKDLQRRSGDDSGGDDGGSGGSGGPNWG